MSTTALPATLLLALRDLGRTDGKELLKRAVKELVSRGHYELVEHEQARRLRSPRRRLLLVDGPAPPPAGLVLPGVARMVAGAPTELVDGRVARELGAVAKHLAKQPKVRDRIVESALAELVAAGLVATEQRKALGVLKRTVHVRTPAGEAALGDPRRDRHRDADDGASYDERPLDSSVDRSFDSTFDSTFDSSFDSSFDSGFSSGDGGGGGGGGGD